MLRRFLSGLKQQQQPQITEHCNFVVFIFVFFFNCLSLRWILQTFTQPIFALHFHAQAELQLIGCGSLLLIQNKRRCSSLLVAAFCLFLVEGGAGAGVSIFQSRIEIEAWREESRRRDPELGRSFSNKDDLTLKVRRVLVLSLRA